MNIYMKFKILVALLVSVSAIGWNFVPAAPIPVPIPVDISFEKVAEIQDFSVTIHAGMAQGSGEIKTRDGVSFVWTAGHVVAHLRSTRQVIDPKSGSVRTLVEFKDAKVVKEFVEDGRSVGRLEMDAEIIRYSDADNGEDLALLRVRKKNFIKSSVQFYLEDKTPPVGTTLYHCGSLLGQVGSNSFTRGIMSQHGRVIYGKVYDQTTCAAFPGSSGGGVYMADGRMVGMIVRGAGETFNLIVPVRRIREWAKTANVEFAIDDKVKMPSDADMKKIPVEEIGASFPSGAADKNSEKEISDRNKKFPYLIERDRMPKIDD
jgi:hypothetical protein